MNDWKFFPLDHEVIMEDIKKFNYLNQKLGVIVHIENDKKLILLQKRGIKSRDENGLYEDVGGKFEERDKCFKVALMRELEEEIGSDAVITLSHSIGIYHCYKNGINWVFVVYFGKYINGEIKIMEPDKCQGYHFFTYEELINSKEVTESCKYLTKSIKKNIKYV